MIANNTRIKIKEIFKGVISGVSEWGLYVELTGCKCEGMVAMRNLTDDFYDYDEDNYRLIGKRTRKQFQLGDEVKVEVARADLSRRQLDFYLSD